MARPIYDFNNKSVTLPAVGVGPLQLIASRRGRVSLILTGDQTSTNQAIRLSISSPDVVVIAFYTLPFTQTFSYRDFGPLIYEPFFAILTGGTTPAVIRATEVFEVG